MAYGMQIYDSTGALRLDLSARVPAIYAQYVRTYNNGGRNQSFTISVPGLTAEYDWYVMVHVLPFWGARENTAKVTINTVNQTITIDYYPYMYTAAHSFNIFVGRL
jgi:hypothetical protein